MISRVIASLALACAVMPGAQAVYAEAVPAEVAAEPPPQGAVVLSQMPGSGPDTLYLELSSLKTGKTAEGMITADVWTFLALGADRSFEGASFSGAWSLDHIDCASNAVANGQVLHLLDAAGKTVRTVTQAVEAKPLAADSLYTYITARICGGKAYAGYERASVVEAMAWAGMKQRAADAPLPPASTTWYFAGQSPDMNVAFATGKDAAGDTPLLYAQFSFASGRKIVGSYYESTYGYLTALEYDCEGARARAVYATYFNNQHMPADSSRAPGEWKPFAGQGLAAPVLQSLCKTGGLSAQDSFTGDGKAAQKWLFVRLRARK